MQTIKEILKLVYDSLRFILISIFLIFWEILKAFIPTKKKNIKGNLVLITGGGNGLGRALALAFADLGANIIIVDVDLVSAQATVEEILFKDVKSKAYQCDVSIWESVVSLCATVSEEFGPVDILINNAGLILFKSFMKNSHHEMSRLLNVNINSNIWMTHAFLEKMIERKKGHIVAISSMAADLPLPWGVLYATSKVAVGAFMNGLRQQLRLDNHEKYIHTTCVKPYFLQTLAVVDNIQCRLASITIKCAVQKIVDGVLKNKKELAIPKYMGFIKFLNLMPANIQDLYRDLVLREKYYYFKCKDLNIK